MEETKVEMNQDLKVGYVLELRVTDTNWVLVDKTSGVILVQANRHFANAYAVCEDALITIQTVKVIQLVEEVLRKIKQNDSIEFYDLNLSIVTTNTYLQHVDMGSQTYEKYAPKMLLVMKLLTMLPFNEVEIKGTSLSEEALLQGVVLPKNSGTEKQVVKIENIIRMKEKKRDKIVRL